MLAQAEVVQSRGARGASPAGAVRVPAQLRWRGLEEGVATRGATRGFLGTVLLRAVDVVTGIVKGKIADRTASEIVKHVDAQVDAGVYALAPEALPKLKGRGALGTMPAAPDGRPSLVLVHGTFVDTSSTFGKLWGPTIRGGCGRCSSSIRGGSSRSTIRRSARARSRTR